MPGERDPSFARTYSQQVSPSTHYRIITSDRHDVREMHLLDSAAMFNGEMTFDNIKSEEQRERVALLFLDKKCKNSTREIRERILRRDQPLNKEVNVAFRDEAKRVSLFAEENERQISDQGTWDEKARLLSIRIRFLSWFDLLWLHPLSFFVHKIIKIVEKIQNTIVASKSMFPRRTTEAASIGQRRGNLTHHFRQ